MVSELGISVFRPDRPGICKALGDLEEARITRLLLACRCTSEASGNRCFFRTLLLKCALVVGFFAVMGCLPSLQ